MHGTYDPAADAAYFYFVDRIEGGAATRSVPVAEVAHQAIVVLDFDLHDCLLGIEIVGAAGMLRPETIASLQQHS